MTTKRILFLLRQFPYGSSHAVEALEAVLVAGVFEQAVSVLFKDDGVWQLIEDQDGDELGVRTVGKVLQSLPEYEVSKLYVCEASLALRGLELDDLVLPATLIPLADQARLLAEQDAVVND
jgi:tRNA 2-thiouridine synthesizing protein C